MSPVESEASVTLPYLTANASKDEEIQHLADFMSTLDPESRLGQILDGLPNRIEMAITDDVLDNILARIQQMGREIKEQAVVIHLMKLTKAEQDVYIKHLKSRSLAITKDTAELTHEVESLRAAIRCLERRQPRILVESITK